VRKKSIPAYSGHELSSLQTLLALDSHSFRLLIESPQKRQKTRAYFFFAETFYFTCLATSAGPDKTV
jgi:hypothetical protein